MLDFLSNENVCLFSPKIEKAKRQKLELELNNLRLAGHVFILSSGSTSGQNLKGYALSKEALLANAAAVNELLELGKGDNWFLSLPPWHVGGLSVRARAFAAGSQVIQNDSKWEPKRWARDLQGAAATSIVPLQAYDIVKESISAPPGLKALVVGGDWLSSELGENLKKLNWPVLRTFGMTEVCSQLATEVRPSAKPALKVLGVHQVKTDENNLLWVKSEALFTGVFSLDAQGLDFQYQSSQECLKDGYFPTSDLASLDGDFLTPLGRSDTAFKSKGRLIYFNQLRDRVEKYALDQGLYSRIELKVINDSREGKALQLTALEELRPRESQLLQDIGALVAPARIKRVEYASRMNRTELGKLKR